MGNSERTITVARGGMRGGLRGGLRGGGGGLRRRVLLLFFLGQLRDRGRQKAGNFGNLVGLEELVCRVGQANAEPLRDVRENAGL